jgi:hypothetical protein
MGRRMKTGERRREEGEIENQGLETRLLKYC